MENEFIPYEQAIALKELDFDEGCLFRYTAQQSLTNKGCYNHSSPSDAMLTLEEIHESHVLAPTYSQAFNWFREKYNLYHTITLTLGVIGFSLEITDTDIDERYKIKGVFTDYKESELICLEKLVEIAKNI